MNRIVLVAFVPCLLYVFSMYAQPVSHHQGVLVIDVSFPPSPADPSEMPCDPMSDSEDSEKDNEAKNWDGVYPHEHLAGAIDQFLKRIAFQVNVKIKHFGEIFSPPPEESTV